MSEVTGCQAGLPNPYPPCTSCSVQECHCADPDYLAFVEQLNAEPLPESKAEAAVQAPKGSQNKPVTALMAFLQEKHARGKKQQTGPLALRSRKDRDSRTRPAVSPLWCSVPIAMAIYSKEQTLDADGSESDDYDRCGRTLLASSSADTANKAR